MKGVLVLVLLHLCNSFQLNTNLNKEIIADLEKLKIKGNFRSLKTIPVPGKDMTGNVSLCVGVFSEELRKLLSNIRVTEDDGYLLTRLDQNLEVLGQNQTKDYGNCRMTTDGRKRNKITPYITKYINFLKKLNNHK